MKRSKLLLSVALVVVCINLAALNFFLHSFQVNPTSVSATLRIGNTEDEDVVLSFPSAGTFDLMVDGNVTNAVYPGILTDLTIPAHGFINKTVSYTGSNTFTNGSHIAQPRYVLPDNPPAGNPQTFYYGTPLTDIYDLQYQFSIDSVGPGSVSGTLTMHNPHSQYWMMDFGYTIVARIFVDGQPPTGMYPPMTIRLYIDPGETHTETISHYASNPYSPGIHYAQARLFVNDNVPVSPPLAFFVEPVEADDETIPAVQLLSLNLSPNPSRGMLNISSNSKEPQTFFIYDIKGRLVFETETTGDYFWDGKDMHLQPCASGVYILIAHQGAKTAVARFVRL